MQRKGKPARSSYAITCKIITTKKPIWRSGAVTSVMHVIEGVGLGHNFFFISNISKPDVSSKKYRLAHFEVPFLVLVLNFVSYLDQSSPKAIIIQHLITTNDIWDVTYLFGRDFNWLLRVSLATDHIRNNRSSQNWFKDFKFVYRR